MTDIKKADWDDKYLLGIPMIDAQHKKLVKLINALYDIATGDEATYKLQMSKVLKALTDYTIYHFADEEQFMTKYGYHSTDTHKIAHTSFINEIHAQIRRLGTGDQKEGLHLYQYLINWLYMHIGKADPIWANFVKPKLPANERG